MADERQRNFATIIYEESVNENWQDILAESHLRILVSPLHDKDINKDGTPKKPHRHVLVMYDGKQNEIKVRMFFQSFNGIGLEKVQSAKGYARYLCHLDEKDKIKYNTSDVLEYGGICYDDFIKNDKDEFTDLKYTLQYIKDKKIIDFAILIDNAVENNEDKILKTVSQNAYLIKQYIESKQKIRLIPRR